MNRVPRPFGGILGAACLLFSAAIMTGAQTPTPTASPSASPTPTIPVVDSFTAQISTSSGHTFVGGISGDGRFVVLESNEDIATEKTTTRNNADRNREIFLFDYAQRRIFQITNTKSTRKDTTKPHYDTAAPYDPSNIAIEVVNNKPVISYDGRWIAFSSNAATPGDFNGDTDANKALLTNDGNTEIFLYEIPAVTAVDLTKGENIPVAIDLTAGTFTNITPNTPASRKPTAGSSTVAPFFADDNRDVAVNDDASVVAFVSTRNLVAGGNADSNPEVFVFNRLGSVTRQVTNTQGQFVFSENPSLSGAPLPAAQTVVFLSNANIAAGGNSNNADGNAELYLGTFDGTTAQVTRQITQTTATNPAVTVNILSPGRRMSRDGNLIAFESLADLEGNGALQATHAIFVYNVTGSTFKQIALRTPCDTLRFPTFTGDSATLVFSSSNFRPDSNFPSVDDQCFAARGVQIYSTPVPPTAANFRQLSSTPAGSNLSLQPHVGATIRRLAFNLGNAELGGGNSDLSIESFYSWIPAMTSEVPASANAITYFTFPSQRPVIQPTPSPSPSPLVLTSAAAGSIIIGRSTTFTFAPANSTGCQSSGSNADCASEKRRMPLPIEVNGVSASINGAAAGIYFAGDTPNEIHLVIPPGLAAQTGTTTYPVVINNNGAVVRSTIQVVSSQPDIATSTNGDGGRAVVFNITNPLTALPEPFTVTSLDDKGQTVATVLRITLTGVRNAQKAQITVKIGTTDITGDAIVTVSKTDTPGFDEIHVKLPASLAAAGDVTIRVLVGGEAASSRAADTAPKILIN